MKIDKNSQKLLMAICNAKSKIITRHGILDFFDINFGVRQGDSILPIFFIIFMQMGLNFTIRKNNRIEFGGN
jgi:hypothetical protein